MPKGNPGIPKFTIRGERNPSKRADVRQKISNALTGRQCTEETKHEISEQRKGKRNSPKTEFKKGHIPPFAGKHIPADVKEKLKIAITGKRHSEETKAKLRAINKRRYFSEEHREKIGIALRGRPHSEEHNAKMIKGLKGRRLSPGTEIKKGQRISPRTELTSEKVKSWWKDPDYRARVIAGRLKNRRPTGPERKLIKIIERHNLPFKYTGNGSFILEGLNPDFVESNGRKIAIDVFGDYWHTLKADKESYTEQGRKAIFEKYGWKLIIIWEKEINSLTEEEIIARIKQ